MAKKIVTRHRIKLGDRLIPPGTTLNPRELGLSQDDLKRFHDQGAIRVVDTEDVPKEDVDNELKAQIETEAEGSEKNEGGGQPKTSESEKVPTPGTAVKKETDAGKSAGSPRVAGANQTPANKS